MTTPRVSEFSISKLLLALLVACLCSSNAWANFSSVNVNLGYNADPVIRDFSNLTTSGTDYDRQGWFLLTQSASDALASGASSVGINDNGTYAASGNRDYDVQLGFTNATAQGANTVLQYEETSIILPVSFTFNVPQGEYEQFALIGSSGNGATTLDITLHYADGDVTISGAQLPDWYAGASNTGTAADGAGTYFNLTPSMSREKESGGAPIQYQTPGGIVGPGAVIYGINLAPDSTRVLDSVTVTLTGFSGGNDGDTIANFFEASGAEILPEPGTWILSALGIAAIGFARTRLRRGAK